MNEQEFFRLMMAAALILPSCTVALIRWRRRTQELRAPEPPKANNYSDLHSQALTWKPQRTNSSAPEAPAQPYAVVMDWAVTQGVATIVAVSDGSASMYYSSGGASIGGSYARPAIRAAALHAISIAGKFLPNMQLTDNFPLPEKDGMLFYVVTEAGVFMARASVELLRTNQHPLCELNISMQKIIAEYRILDTTVVA